MPDVGDVPLVADLSSTILSRPLDVTPFGLIYAGAQKNIGPSGLVRRHRARRPARHGAPRHADRVRTARRWPTTARCSTRRRLSAGTSPAWCSSGSSARAASRRWSERNRAKAEKLYAAIDGVRLLHAIRWHGECRSLDERAVHAARSRSWTSRSCRRRQGAGLVNLEGPPLGRRHAREHLQRDADGRRRGAGRVHDGFPANGWSCNGVDERHAS